LISYFHRRRVACAFTVLSLAVVLPERTALAQSQISATLSATPAAKPLSGFMVPKQVQLRATSPAEAEAHAIWNLRAGLNVAALQCQFSPFLRTVRNYNEFLAHHSSELNKAQAVMKGHFRRYDGARSLNSFDQYTTRTYNSYSTLDAQYSFCAAAAEVGRRVLTQKRGQLGNDAPNENLLLRGALVPQPMLGLYEIKQLSLLDLPLIEPWKEERRRRR
jgi:hypothetical protein